GVLGASRLTPGVHGWSQTDNGVEGESDSATGVWGASRRAYGVLGQTGGFPFGPRFTDPNNPPSRGDQRSAPAGRWGTATDTFAVAGSSFKASGAVSQNSFGVVATSQAGKRVLHCMESPEHWFEDFGSARLTRGKATVKLDADFAKVVKLTMSEITTIGLDLAKHVFQVHGID